MAKHSPGPWFVGGNEDHYGIIDANGKFVAYLTKDANRGNVAALKSAPDLLAALDRLARAALYRDTTMGDQCRLLEAKAELDEARRHACRVLRKAEGAE